MVLNVPCSWVISDLGSKRAFAGRGNDFPHKLCHRGAADRRGRNERHCVGAVPAGAAAGLPGQLPRRPIRQPPPQAYPPQRQLPAADADDDVAPFYDPPVHGGRPVPPGAVRLAPGTEVPPQAIIERAPPPGTQYRPPRTGPPADVQPQVRRLRDTSIVTRFRRRRPISVATSRHRQPSRAASSRPPPPRAPTSPASQPRPRPASSRTRSARRWGSGLAIRT